MLLRLIGLPFVLMFTLVISAPGFSAPPGFLEKNCQVMGGTIVNGFTCPYSGDERDQAECVVTDKSGRSLFFDGCSGTIGNYDVVFFNACVHHDLCYHHEPNTNGLKKEDCDSQFFNDMFDVCEKQRPNDPDCEDAARWFYNAVDVFGKTSWICSKETANYRSSSVWSELLGMLNLSY